MAHIHMYVGIPEHIPAWSPDIAIFKWLNSPRNGETSLRAVEFSSLKQYTPVGWNMHSFFTLKRMPTKQESAYTFCSV